MMKFKALREADSASEQDAGGSSLWETRRTRSSASDNSHTSNGRISNSDDSEEASSYALQERSSVCEDSEDFRRTLARVDTSSSAGVGSAVFQNFLCVFDEKHAIKESQRQMAFAKQQSEENAKKVVSLPQFLWQPEGLCCRAENVNLSPEHDGMIFFEEPDDGHYSYAQQSEADENDNDDDLPLLPSGDETSAFDGPDTGSSSEPKKYVPRPSSTTPGLREVSKLFRTSSDPEGSVYQKNVWEQDATAVITPPRGTTSDQEMIMEPPLKSPPHTLTKSRSTPPFSLKGRLHRRNASESSTGVGSSVFSPLSGFGSAFKAHKHSSDPSTSSVGKKTKNPVRNLFKLKKMPSFRKRAMFQSTHKKTSAQSVSTAETPGSDNDEGLADINSILDSLELTLKAKEESEKNGGATWNRTPAIVTPSAVSKKSKGFKKRILKNRSTSPQPHHDQPLSSQGSEDTYSVSSLDELFSSFEHEESYHDDRDEIARNADSDCSSEEDDRFFVTPHDHFWHNRKSSKKFGGKDNHPSAFLSSSSSSSSSLFAKPHNRYKAIQDSMEDRNAAILSMHDLSRTSSVDTAKASNLSYDPIGDRARLLDLQAFLRQQHEESLKRQNAPPLDFEAGDNLIRVRDAMCEIEVLPKREYMGSPYRKQKGTANSTSSVVSSASMAADF